MTEETQKLVRVLGGDYIHPAPVWFMRQAGRYLPEYRAIRARHKDFLSFCYTPEDAAEVTLQPIRRFGMDAAIIFSDILVVPHAMGSDVRFVEGKGPVLSPIRDRAAIDALTTSRVEEFLAPVSRTLELVKPQLPAHTTLIGFAGAPWTVAAYMVEGSGSRDFAHARQFAYAEPETFALLIARLTEATILYLFKQVESGADVLQLFDSWAGVLAPDEFARWVVAPTQIIVKALKARHPGLRIIGFPRGAGISCQWYAEQTGVDGVGIDTATPLEWASKALPGVALQGNLDPVLLAADGKAAAVAAVEQMRRMQGRPYILNLGHGILPHTPPEHVQHVCDAIRNAA